MLFEQMVFEQMVFELIQIEAGLDWQLRDYVTNDL